MIVQILGEWQTEIIRDPSVIRAYVRGRQALEEEATLADSLAPTGDAAKDLRAKKRSVIVASVCK
jgi:transcription initiation factor TFIID subunit 1, fungi type